MPSIYDAFIGTAVETTFNSVVAPNKFWVFKSEKIAPVVKRLESEGIRAGTRTQREDRWLPVQKGAQGNVNFEVESRQFGFWLPFMLGPTTTSAAVQGVYTHTATEGTTNGKSFTLQVNRPSSDGSNHAFTYTGCKLSGWELSCDVDGFLQFNADIDAAQETIDGSGGYALATPSYQTGIRVLSFIGGTIQVAGSNVRIKKASIKAKMGLEEERYFIGGGPKAEQLESKMRTYDFELTAEYENLAHYQRVVSATAAGAVASLQLTFQSDVAEAGGGFAKLVVTAPAARWDGGDVAIDKVQLQDIKVKGQIMQPAAGGSPLTIAYSTAEPTP